jgi:signal recognition particle GTPase
VDPRISAIYKEAVGLVGIDGPREELVSCLTDPQKKLKVVFIVGSGGLGKTTLAKQVYDKIEGQFDCTTFVSASSQRPDVESLLSDVLLNLGMREFSQTLELHDIIDRLREHLKHKRYVFFSTLICLHALGLIIMSFHKSSSTDFCMV